MKKIALKSNWIRSVVVIAGLTIFIALGWSMCQRDASQTPIPPITSKTQETQSKHTTPTYRAAYHFTVPDKWKNDPQRPIYMDGKYHYYYLYNRDYPEKNGTEWRHATSTDLVHWKDEGVSIPKYTNPNGDPWSGSVVIDDNNSAGFGKGALVAVVTQPSAHEGKQEQFLWYSVDKGKTFTSYSNAPVMPNPGIRDFRDPKIIRDLRRKKWIMVMAEGTKIGFYESDNLKKWRYMSGFSTENIGIVECPDLYRMRAEDGAYKWILGASANGKSTGKPNTYAYWTGDFDGNHFSPDDRKPEWLDYGFDWYGAVTFEDGKGSYSYRYALAWMNKWDYANNTPTLKEGFNGMDSVVREIRLKHEDGSGYRLVSQPVEALKQSSTSRESLDQIEVNGTYTLPIKADSYQLETDISWSALKNVGLRLRESEDGKRHVDAGVSLEGHYSYVNRAYTGQPDQSGAYVESKASFDVNRKNVHLTVLVDKTSIEVFVDAGAVVHSNLIFPRLDDQGITLFTDGGTAIFKNVVISNFVVK